MDCFVKSKSAGVNANASEKRRPVFAIRRTVGNEELICLANFSEYGQNAWLNCLEGEYEDLFTGEKLEINSVWMNPYQYRWCVKK